MSNVLALVPARLGSKGIPGKNWRRLGGKHLFEHAYDCAIAAGCERVVISSDRVIEYAVNASGHAGKPRGGHSQPFLRPAGLSQDDTPMVAVVQHALQQIPGPPDQIILLLQPTQPFRTPAHIVAALRLLRESQADSVVSVVPLPLTHSPQYVCDVVSGRLGQWLVPFTLCADCPEAWGAARRQDVRPAYKRDGTVYAFWRKTVEQYGNLYGCACRPLILDPSESCDMDTEADWLVVERRWNEQHG